MHTKSAVVITLLMVSSLVGACGPDFFAPYVDPDHVYSSFSVELDTKVSKKRNGEIGVADQSVKRFLFVVGQMDKVELLELLNESGAKLLSSIRAKMKSGDDC